MIRKKLLNWCVCALSVLAVQSCTESIDTSARYVFEDETVLSYLQKHEAYSEYTALLDVVKVSSVSETTVAQLLSARGNYTCFAPTNEAIQEYLDTLAAQEIINDPSWGGFKSEKDLDSIRKVIVYNSIIDGGDVMDNYYQISDFPVADKAGEMVEFDLPNLNDRKLNVKTPGGGQYFINECPMSDTQCDILVTNGVIHQVLSVVAPSDLSASSYFVNILKAWRESKDATRSDSEDALHGELVLARVLEACGLFDTLSAVRDEVYETKYLSGEIKDLQGMHDTWGFAEGSTACVPRHRKYGFTIFSEGDDYWRSVGIDPEGDSLLVDLMQWIVDNNQYSEGEKYVVDTLYKKENNMLHQWITYHILPMRIPTDKLIIHDNELGYSSSQPKAYTIPVYEYYTTMGQRRLMKIYESKESNGVYLNRFPKLNNGRDEDGHEASCDEDKIGCLVLKDSADLNSMSNCIIYRIKGNLSYNDFNRDQLAKDRLRFDGMSLFPEAMSNDIRRNKQASGNSNYRWVHIPENSIYKYFENMDIADGSKFVYYNTYENWCNLYEDEMKAVGRFEITVTLPPVPRKGIYELRYDVLGNGNRGVVQPYFGHDLANLPVTGIPMDLTMDAKNNSANRELMGWKDDTGDPDADAETDHAMRNNGFMKGCNSVSDRSGGSERMVGHAENSRRILWRGEMYPEKTYYLKLKSVLQSSRSEFYMDYLELCPKEVYDNPETPEDIW